ncbi:hypothetical protein KC727_02815 [Candidatus Kaiserbacteria bacterium]|nr:hypothetical protein [Candidatus Kaiserbacteria bacterium]
MKKYLSGLTAAFALMPVFAFAQNSNLGYFSSFFRSLSDIINNILVPLVFGLALLTFFWGVLKYFIFSSDDEEKRKEGRQLMLYGIIGFVVMVAIWGIVGVLTNALGIGGNNSVTLPTIPGAR